MIPLIPQPYRIQELAGFFGITPQMAVSAGPGAESLVRTIADVLADTTGFSLVTVATDRPAVIHVELQNRHADLGTEGYCLRVVPNSVYLCAASPTGLLRAVQTLRQLLLLSEPDSPLRIPCCEIEDRPRFEWRGCLLDACRHFWSVEDTLRFIDLLALYRMNRLHWHLTEDQGWRIEISGYPELTRTAAWRTEADGSRYGGYYTHQDIRRVVQYASDRGILVVPEIEMPGHATAALAAYPELSCTGGPFRVPCTWGIFEDVYCAGSERVFRFLEEVLAEVMELFPSRWIHVGGDECPKNRWKACPRCQERIRTEKLRDEYELQKYFINRMERFLSAHGRVLVGWDEILESAASGQGHEAVVSFSEDESRVALAPGAVVQSWRGIAGGVAAARSGHDVIMSPTTHCYLDYAVTAVSTQKMYEFEPVPPELSAQESRHVRGLEGALWTENIATRARLDYQAFPRLCALAEVGWSPKPARSWSEFRDRLAAHARLFDKLHVSYWRDPAVWPEV